MVTQTKQATLGLAVESYLAELRVVGRSPRTIESQAYVLGKLAKKFDPSQPTGSTQWQPVALNLALRRPRM
jgi:hypothetical protein